MKIAGCFLGIVHALASQRGKDIKINVEKLTKKK